MSTNKAVKNDTEMGSSKCTRCIGKCCRYALVDLPTPRSRLEFNNYAWYLAHENTVIYVDDKQWYLSVNNKCRYLDDNNLCTIYEKRFQACRDHSDENCEFDSEFEADMTFNSPFELLEYAERKFAKAAKKRAATRKLTLKSRKK